MPDSRIVVVHAFPVWLPQTQAWLHTMVRGLPEPIESHVVCERTEHLDQFDVPRLRVESRHGPRVLRLVPDRWQARRHAIFVGLEARRLSADVLHSQFGDVGWVNLTAARLGRARHVVSFYGHDASAALERDHRWPTRYRQLFRRAALVLVVGPVMRQRLLAFAEDPAKVVVHHLGVDLDRLPSVPRTWDGVTPLRVLIVGSFREKKGIPYALDAIVRLRRDIPVEATVIGDAGRDERSATEKRRILALAERAALGASVRFLGYQPQHVVFREAYAHHVFLAPSVTAGDGDAEGLPVTLIEMAATGMPIVSTRHADIPELVEHETTGLLADERDVDGLVSHMRWLVEHRDRWTAMAAAARARIESEFNARVQGARLARLYRQVVG